MQVPQIPFPTIHCGIFFTFYYIRFAHGEWSNSCARNVNGGGGVKCPRRRLGKVPFRWHCFRTQNVLILPEVGNFDCWMAPIIG
ncbi:unnamed protein product [Hermetia illucens]|uniref:Uncharacterized protein n=1 Tax=Hermetia illucens TaxID=343691 RepID=A0A7R8V113_HERIL|nr:unnamed protein product [Hermetia illucens]